MPHDQDGDGPDPPDVYASSGQPLAVEQPVDPPTIPSAVADELPQDLLEAHQRIVDALRTQGDRRSTVRTPDDLTDATNILGVGIGRAAPPYGTSGPAQPGGPTLAVYLEQPRHPADVESVLSEQMNADAVRSSAVQVIPVVTGQIESIAHDFRVRPAPGGSSVFSTADPEMYGTMACLATGRSAPRNQWTLALSCNHVIANLNYGTVNECITQPAGGDRGTCPADQIASLERFVKINYFGPTNYVDCATAVAWRDRVSPQLLSKSPAGPVTFPISGTTVAAYPGMSVGKSGRSTEVTLGNVREVGVSHWLRYRNGGEAFFAGSIAIEGVSVFATSGDSGALVWTWDLNRNPVGLLFAATPGAPRAFANQIDVVTQSLDIFITP